MRGRRKVLVAAVAILLAGFSVASADTLQDLGYGWTATVPDHVTIMNVSLYSPTAIKLDIEKDFTEGLDEGRLPSIVIGFTKASNGVPDLIIDSETVYNHTGHDWLGYDIAVYPETVGIESSYTGLTGLPFTNVEFYAQGLPVTGGSAAEDVYFSGGMVPNGGMFKPGGPADAGNWIMIHTQDEVAVSLVLKETPETPEPVSLLLLSIGLAFVKGGRRAS